MDLSCRAGARISTGPAIDQIGAQVAGAAAFADRDLELVGRPVQAIGTAQQRVESVELAGCLRRRRFFVIPSSTSPTRSAALRRAREALRSGGLVLIPVPNFGSWQHRRFGSLWYHLDLPRHRVHFTAAALHRALDRAGLEATSITTSTSPVGLPASIQYALAGHSLFPGGLPLRVAVGLCALAWPLSRVRDWLGGGGDVLEALARRSA